MLPRVAGAAAPPLDAGPPEWKGRSAYVLCRSDQVLSSPQDRGHKPTTKGEQVSKTRKAITGAAVALLLAAALVGIGRSSDATYAWNRCMDDYAAAPHGVTLGEAAAECDEVARVHYGAFIGPTEGCWAVASMPARYGAVLECLDR